jgi:drug/metabolite transporter (DMT)-like permease
VFQAWLRFAAAAVLLWAWCRWRAWRCSSPMARWAGGLLAGALFAGEFVCIYVGLQHTTASRLTVFLYTSPFWVALILPRFPPSACAGCSGSAWCWPLAACWPRWASGWAAALAARGQWLGDLLGLSAGLMWGLTTVVLRSAPLGQVGPEKQLFYQTAVSVALLPLVSLALGEHLGLAAQHLRAGLGGAAGRRGAFASYLTWMWMLGHYPATKVSAFVFLTPVFALAVGAAGSVSR